MANSYSQSADLHCPDCGQPFRAEVWLIVDVAERPDLLARLRAARLHLLPCPHCGAEPMLDAPLLVYSPASGPLPEETPRLIFSPAHETAAEQAREQALGLLQHLASALGEAWQDGWLHEMATVQRALLPVALSDDPEAALEDLRRRAPDLWAKLQEEEDAGAGLEDANTQP